MNTGNNRPGDQTDESLTPPHGDPEKAHRATDTDLIPPKADEPTDSAGKPSGTTQDQIESMENEGPGPAEGHTDNKAGG